MECWDFRIHYSSIPLFQYSVIPSLQSVGSSLRTPLRLVSHSEEIPWQIKII